MADRCELMTSTGKRPKTRKSLAYIPSSQNSTHENSSTDLGAQSDKGKDHATKKKLSKARSRSIGPGGLDVLQKASRDSQDHSMNKVPLIFPRPILKLTMPSLQNIPVQTKTLQGEFQKSHAVSEFDTTMNLIDLNFDQSNLKNSEDDKSSLLTDRRSSDAKNQSLIDARHQDEQTLLILDQAEKERQDLQNEINLRRDARRKSLANRRVSFAPEATLHTWDLVLEYQDSTTSTNSTSSKNKAQSLLSKTTDTRDTQVTSSSTSPAVTDYLENTEAAAISSDTKKKRRRSSVIAPSNTKNPDNIILSSPISENIIDDNNNTNVNEASNSDSDPSGDETLTSLESGDYTNISFILPKLDETTGSSTKLSNASRQKAHKAGSKGTESNEKLESNKSEETVTASFTPFSGKDTAYLLRSQNYTKDTCLSSPISSDSLPKSENFQENVDHTAKILTNARNNRNQMSVDEVSMGLPQANDKVKGIKSSSSRHQINSLRGEVQLESFGSPNSNISEDESMDFTVALGNINEKDDSKSRDRNTSFSTLSHTRHSAGLMTKQNQSTISKHQGKPNLNVEEENMDKIASTGFIVNTADQGMDATMEVTNAYGGIIKTIDQDMDATMEVTNAYGGIIKTIDQDVDATMEVTNAYGGIIKTIDQDMDATMEVTNAYGGIIKSNDQDMDATMEVTNAYGGIIKTIDQDMDATMEVTNAYGGIIKTIDQDVDATMEVTNAYGGIIKSNDQDMDATMEVTNAYGGIIKSNDQDMDATMEVTNAYGDINKSMTPDEKSDDKFNTVHGNQGFGKMSQINQVHNPKPEYQPNSLQTSYLASINPESPSLGTLHAKGTHRPRETRNQIIPRARQSEDGFTPRRDFGSPSKIFTPLPANSFQSCCISPSKKLRSSSSPWHPSKSENNFVKCQKSLSDWPKTLQYNALQVKQAGFLMPNSKLTPQSRRSSGIGIDKVGLGSPRVAALLDRRDSISNQARSFIPGELAEAPLGARLKDPRIIEQELDQEVGDESHPNEKIPMDNETEEPCTKNDNTLNLMEMIQSLTPRKKPLRDQKYLRIGETLRKRPADIDEDDDEIEGIKRLRNHLGSPVKDVRLQAPPSKNETTSGRIVQATKKDLEETNIDSNFSKLTVEEKNRNLSIYKCQSPQKACSHSTKTHDLSPFQTKFRSGNPEIEANGCKNNRIQLQDFLNMTSIRFLELTTTKRRHTIALQSNSRDSGQSEKRISLEDCVAAGAATIPMLELFQHACHELKRYISEGRKTVREIETETWEENPPLFQEYISASPDLKALMDNQLKNVKTYSRLLSKDLWYDWRMTLHGTLKEGLVKAAEGFNRDEASLNHQQLLLDKILPSSIETVKSLMSEENDLRVAAQEISSCNQEELKQARHRMSLVEKELESKKLLLLDLRKQFQKIESEIELRNENKQKLKEKIVESEQTREKYKGWTASEINSIKSRVQRIEKSYGWSITGVSGSSISISYRNDIRLTFDASLIYTNTKQSRIDEIRIENIGSKQKKTPVPPVDVEFFLKCIEKYLHEAVHTQTNFKGLLDFVSKSWENARIVSRDIRLLTLSYPTEMKTLSEDSMMIISTLLIVPLSTKVSLTFHLTAKVENTEVKFVITTEANVIYGERLNELKISEFISSKCGNEMKEKGKNTASWGDTVRELVERLLARSRK